MVERSRTRLFALAFAELRHYQDAEDAVSSALVRICTGIGGLRESGRAREWMHNVVRNEARRTAARRGASADSAFEEATTPDNADQTLLRVAVQAALRSLPAREARVLALFYWGGLSIQEIAVRVGRPEGTVKSWLHHGRRHLSRQMEEPQMDAQATAVILGGTSKESQEWTWALRRAGYREVRQVSTYLDAASLRETGEEEGRELHLPPALAGARLLFLNEWIEGRSAFEVTALLRATVER